ncbi:MAG: histidine kinase N-terminal 7TM domain-containing protein, partial [Acutalibacteraceae bacterium]
MKSRRKGGDFPAAAALCLFVFAGLLRFVNPHNTFFDTALFYFCSFLYFGLILCWMSFVQKRFISNRMRTLLICMAFFLLFYIFLRTMRYRCISLDAPRLSRFFWYLYYLPQIFAPLISFVAASCVGRAEDEKLSKRWWAAFFAADVLSVGILTNDFHQLAFRFRPDFLNWNTDYSYGILFYLVTVWIYFWLLASIVMLYHKCRISSIRQRVWLPFIWLPVGTLFVIMLALEEATGIPWLFRLPETHCFILIAIWESCIKIGLVPSNIEYNDFFSHSSLDVQIADADGKVIYCSENA